jgi:hypothetical protein
MSKDDKVSVQLDRHPQLSRRSFLMRSAATGMLLDLRHSWLGSNIQIESGPGWLALNRNAIEVFRLQSNAFHGKPNLWVSKNRERITFGLDGARLPGTKLCADMTGELWKRARGLYATLNHQGLGLEFRGLADDWLGGAGLWAHLSRAVHLIEDDALDLVLSSGPVRLASDGVLHFRSATTAALGSYGPAITGWRTELAPVQSDSPTEPIARRSTIVMHRRTGDWNIKPLHGKWSYPESTTLFDRVQFTAHEGNPGEMLYRAEFSRSPHRRPFSVVLDEPLVDTAGRSPDWRMRNPIYAVELGARPNAKLTAELARPVRLKFGSLHLNLSNPSEAPSLLAQQSGGGEPKTAITARASLEGKLYEQIILDSHDNWNVAIGRDEKAAKDYADATVKMAGANISLEGAVNFRILRPLDALDLKFCITNVRVESLSPEQPWLLKLTQADDPSGLSLMLVDVGPQTLLEQAFPSSSQAATDNCGNIPPAQSPQSKIAARSQVALQLFNENSDDAANLTLDTLLDWWKYPLHIVPQAETSPTASPLTDHEPLTKATDIVAPAGLSFSPTETQVLFATKEARVDDLAKGSRMAQIWHTRLMTRRALPPAGAGSDFSQFAVTQDTRPHLRPVWPRPIQDDSIYGFSNQNTIDIVADMATVVLDDKDTNTTHLCLSSAGAWLRTKGIWPLDPHSQTSFKVDIAAGEELLEEITVETVTIPSGHRVTVVFSTKRQWCRRNQAPQFLVARLIKRVKIKYHQKTVEYTSLRDGSLIEGALAFPFDSISLIGDETPYLDEDLAQKFRESCLGLPKPQCATDQGICGTDQPYWADVLDPKGPVPYPFPVQCVDRAGVTHVTTMPMVLACAYNVYDVCYAKRHVGFYNSTADQVQIAPDFGKARIAYAQARKKGDTSYPTGRMTLGAVLVQDLCAAQAAGTPPWYPVMLHAELSLDQLAAFGTGASNTPPTFMYADQYLADPFDQKNPKNPATNPAELLLVAGKTAIDRTTTVAPPISLGFAGKLGGGLAMPQTGVQAVSRLQGTVFRTLQTTATDVTDVTNFLTNVGNGAFKLADFIGGMGLAASLLGAVELGDILQDVDNALAQAANVPLLAARQIQTIEATLIQDLKDALAPVLAFQATLQSTVESLRDQAKAVLAEVQALVQNAVSYVKVTLFEQAASDVDGLIKTLEPSDDTGPVHALKTMIAQSAAVRIAKASSLPDATKIMPTLYQLRDYAAYQLIDNVVSVANAGKAKVEQAATPAAKAAAEASAAQVSAQASSTAQAAINHIETWLDAELDSVTQELNYQLSSVGQAFASILGCYVFQVADDLQALNTAVSEQSGDQLSDVITALENVASDVAGFGALGQQLTSLFTTFKTNLNGLFESTITTFKNTIGTVAPPSGFIQEVETALNPYPNVATAVESAAAGMITSADISTWSGQFQNQLGQAISFVNDVNSAVTTIQNAVATVNDAITKAMELLAIPQQISVAYDYNTPLNSSGPFVAELKGTQSEFTLHSSVLVNLDGTPPQFTVQAQVTNFQLILLPSAPFVSIGFTLASFSSVNGASPSVSCPLDPNNVQLLGPLDFVSNLASTMGLPPYMRAQIIGLGVIVGVNLPFPDIETGAFVMMNLSFYAGVQLDFTGQPMQVTFGFANPSQHFVMIYAFLGGGGFIDLTFTPSKTLANMDIAGALEAGAMLAVDFGVASGEVHAFAGFYMNLSSTDCVLSGYFRCGGDFEVLGLISASIEFTMSLTYEDRGGTAWLSGECDVVVDVSVLFFSTSVSLSMHHDFCGSSTD